MIVLVQVDYLVVDMDIYSEVAVIIQMVAVVLQVVLVVN